MEKYFEVSTLYNDDTMRAFYDFHLFKRQHISKAFFIVMGVIILLGGSAILILERFQNPFRVMFFLLMGVFSCTYPFWMPKLLINSMQKSDLVTRNKVCTVTCYQDRLEVITEQSRSFVYYGQLYQAWETRDFFYLYLNKQSAYILYKQAFSLGDAARFSTFLQQVMPGRFRVKL